MSNNSSSNTSSIARANGAQACAACKYQRRKCAPDCILAPYFPHDRLRQFLNAHKLFGVSNITKIIRNLDQPEKDEAMQTIIFQSDVRAADPVGGCYRIILELQKQIEYTKAELDLVLQQIDVFKNQNQQQIILPEANDSALAGAGDILNEEYEAASYQNLEPPCQEYGNDDDDEQVSLHDINSWAIHDPTMPVASLLIKQQSSADDECNDDDIKPLLDLSGDRHEPKETTQSSDETIFKEDRDSLKEQNQAFKNAKDHDLKGAATLFTLTHCNS